MKIAFIGGRDIHKLGGIENYMFNLATQLVKMGHEPIVFCESDHNCEEKINGFRVIYQKGPKSRFLCKPWLGLKSTWRVIWDKDLMGVDFIHYNAAGPAKGSFLARLKGIPEAMQGHGLEWERPKYSPIQKKLLRWFCNSSVKSQQFLLMCSEVQSNYYKENFSLSPITIPTAINLPSLEYNKTDILDKFNIKSRKYFLLLARLVQDKNPHFLIEAFKKAKLIDYQLVIAGNNPADIPFVDKLHDLAKDNPDIIFTDAVYGDDKETLLRNAYAFCVPSTIEGLSISLLEGMGFKLPIIASDIPANKEVLDEDKAYWCKPEDIDSLSKALKECIHDENRQEKVDFNYKKIESTYTWEIVAEKYIYTISKFIKQLSN